MAYRDLTHAYRIRREHHLLKPLEDVAPLDKVSSKISIGNLFRRTKQPSEVALLEEGACIEMVELDRPLWMQDAEEATEAIRLLHIKLEYLQALHTRRLMIRFDDSEAEQDKEIQAVTQDMTHLFRTSEQGLSRMRLRSHRTHADVLIQENSRCALAQKLQRVSHEYRAQQQTYIERLELHKFGASHFSVTDSTTDGREYKRKRLDWEAEEEVELMSNLQDIERRDAEIDRIAKSVAALSAVFKEIADMVIDHGTVVDRIDYNVDQAAMKARSGLQQLQKAEKYERSTRPDRCIKVLVVLIAGCFIILISKQS